MRLNMITIATVSILVAGSCTAWAQDLSPVRPLPGRPKPAATAPAKPDAEADEKAAKARREAEAKAKAWDLRVKRSMGSICRGAPGC
jgi:hypothetical protein